jgi:hypothetical protein
MATKTYSGAAGVEAGRPTTKIRAEQVRSEDGFNSLAVDLEALRGQVKDIIGAADYKEEITGEYSKVQIVDLADHLDASQGASALSVKKDIAVVGSGSIAGTLDVNGQATFASANVEDLTSGRIVVAGASGELADHSGFTFSTGEFVAPSATISDLSSGRVVVAGTAGALGDSANLTFDGTDLTMASAKVSDLTATRVVYAGTDGALVDSSEMTFNTATGLLTLAKDLQARSGSFSGDLTVAGNLLVSGDTVTVNVGELTVEDKNILIANVASPSDALADGAGITIKGTTDKTILWVDASDSFEFSEPVVAPSGSFLNLASRLAKSDAQGKLVNAEITDFVQGTANQVIVGAVNASGMSTLSLPQSIDTNADVEFDTLKLGDLAPDHVGKALKVGADGAVVQAAWDEFVAIESNVGLELIQSGFKAEIGLAQDIRSSATIQFARVELDGTGNYVDSSADGLVLHAGAAGDSVVFEYDAGKTISLGTASLVGFTATDIMGALNELKATATNASKKAAYTNSGASEIAAGTDIAALITWPPSGSWVSELTGQNSLVFVNGMLMQAGGLDYTLSAGAGTISFAFALQPGDVVVIQKA